VYGIAFSDDGRLLLTIGDWGREQLWNGVTGEHLYSVSGASCRFVVAPDGQTLATAQCTSTYADLGIWRLDGSETPEFMGARMERGLVDLVFAPDSTLLAAGAMYSIQVWDVVGKRKTRDFFVISDNVSSLIFSPDNETLVAGTGKGSLKFWDVSSGTELRTVRGHKGPVHGLAFSPDGRFLASAGDDATVKLWSAR
jgi:WD40 repeat protein